MQNYSIQEIVEQAIQTERLGYEFYRTLAGMFAEEKELAKLFEYLAAQEVLHEKSFSAMKERVFNVENVDWEEASHYLRAIVESEFFLGNKKALPSLTNIKNRKEALRHALSFEKETLLYFYAMREIIAEHGILDGIINEEKAHIRELSKLMK